MKNYILQSCGADSFCQTKVTTDPVGFANTLYSSLFASTSSCPGTDPQKQKIFAILIFSFPLLKCSCRHKRTSAHAGRPQHAPVHPLHGRLHPSAHPRGPLPPEPMRQRRCSSNYHSPPFFKFYFLATQSSSIFFFFRLSTGSFTASSTHPTPSTTATPVSTNTPRRFPSSIFFSA